MKEKRNGGINGFIDQPRKDETTTAEEKKEARDLLSKQLCRQLRLEYVVKTTWCHIVILQDNKNFVSLAYINNYVCVLFFYIFIITKKIKERGKEKEKEVYI